MKAAFLLFLLLLSCCKRRDETWIGIDRSIAACTYSRGSFYEQTCVSIGRVYTCVLDYGGTSWQCAPRTVMQSAESP